MTALSGVFHDGKTATQQSVRPVLGAAGIEIRREDDTTLVSWPYRQLKLIERARDGSRLRLTCGEEEDARLTLTDRELIRAIEQRAPQLVAARRVVSPRMLLRGAGVAAIVFLLAGAVWFGWPRLADQLARVVPASWEATLGQRLITAMLEDEKLCAGREGQAAIDRLTARLLAKRPPGQPVSVRVVDAEIVNAFAAPGGHVVLYRGLIDKAESAEEVAGVLAHELGHVIERHATRMMVRWSGLELLSIVLLGQSDIGSLGSILLGLGYSRDFEREADARALQLLAEADIQGHGLIRFFARLEKDEKGLGRTLDALRYVSTHPTSAERRATLERNAVDGGPAMSAAEWQAMRGMCKRP